MRPPSPAQDKKRRWVCAAGGKGYTQTHTHTPLAFTPMLVDPVSCLYSSWTTALQYRVQLNTGVGEAGEHSGSTKETSYSGFPAPQVGGGSSPQVLGSRGLALNGGYSVPV